jgi:hypothetical protein
MSLMPIASLSPVSPNGSGAGFCLRNRSSAAALTRRTQGEGRPRALRARRRPRGALRQNNHVNKGTMACFAPAATTELAWGALDIRPVPCSDAHGARPAIGVPPFARNKPPEHSDVAGQQVFEGSPAAPGGCF